jgi:Cys-tRNA(Pro) deacylase
MKISKLKEYLDKNDVEAKFYEFDEHTITVEAAAKRLNITADKIVKSIVFIDQDGKPLLAIVSGDKRVDEKKLAEASNSQQVRIAKAREVEKFTGYKIGELPPVGHGLRTFVDSKVMSLDKVIGGGGSTHTLIEISPNDIVKLTNAKVCNISC